MTTSLDDSSPCTIRRKWGRKRMVPSQVMLTKKAQIKITSGQVESPLSQVANQLGMARNSSSLYRAEPSSGAQCVEQGFGVLQIERVEALGEPAVDRGEKIAGLVPLSVTVPGTRHTPRRAQLP